MAMGVTGSNSVRALPLCPLPSCAVQSVQMWSIEPAAEAAGPSSFESAAGLKNAAAASTCAATPEEDSARSRGLAAMTSYALAAARVGERRSVARRMFVRMVGSPFSLRESDFSNGGRTSG
jgi:hypothetical protein